MELEIILTLAMIVMAITVIKLSQPDINVPFQRKSQLFTSVERSFIQLLEQAVGHEFRILCRVRLADVLAPRSQSKQAKAALAKACTKQLDFILCDKHDMTPLIAIDLVSNKSKDHKEGYKTQRDWFVSSALESAHVAHIRIKVKPGYTINDVRECIESKLVEYRKQKTKQPIISTQKRPTRPTRPLQSSRQPAKPDNKQVAA